MKKLEDLKNVKLVVCDIDNTLVVKRQDLTEYSKEIIKKLQDKGILFALASGRGCRQLKNLADKWDISCELLIGMNGAEIYDGLDNTHEIYYNMKAEWVKECFELMLEFESLPHIVCDGYMLARKNDTQAAASAKYAKNTFPTYLVEKDEEFYEKDAIKMGFRVSADIMPSIEAKISKYTNDNWTAFKTETTMFEFGNAQANKGKVLKLFCDKHNIDINETVAFGDMTNDISMLEAAGIAVCMLNGSDDAKAVSDIITDKTVDEDGWTVFVEDYIL